MLMPMELFRRQITLLTVMDSELPQPIYHKHQLLLQSHLLSLLKYLPLSFLK